MRYLRMLSNSLIAAAVASGYLTTLVLQLNPSIEIGPATLLPLALVFGVAYGANLTVAFYALIVQVFIHRDISIRRNLPRTLTECITVIGGVLIIVGVAVGLTNYLVGAQVPAMLADWVRAHIASRLMFLLALNLFLLVVGAMMDIFAAIVVVVPLIIPLGAAFGVDPVHLGIIFIANLELGLLTPLVGVNVFLASYRFHKPVIEILRSVLPFFALLAVGVLAITYLPWLTLALLDR